MKRTTAANNGPTKRPSRRVILAWLLCLLCITGATITLILWLGDSAKQYSLMERVSAIIGWNWGIPVVFSALAALLITRRPHNRVGWLLMLPALALVVSNSLTCSWLRRRQSLP